MNERVDEEGGRKGGKKVDKVQEKGRDDCV